MMKKSMKAVAKKASAKKMPMKKGMKKACK